MKVNPIRSANTSRVYRQNLRVNLPDWVNRPLNAITRRDVEERFLALPKNTAGRGRTRRRRCCARCTGARAWITRG